MGLLILLFLISVPGGLKVCYRTIAWPTAIIWICAAVYAILGWTLVSVAQHAGVQDAVESSRYVVASAILPIAATALACVCIARFRAHAPPLTTWYSVSLVAITSSDHSFRVDSCWTDSALEGSRVQPCAATPMKSCFVGGKYGSVSRTPAYFFLRLPVNDGRTPNCVEGPSRAPL
jgi:hypothetical protein